MEFVYIFLSSLIFPKLNSWTNEEGSYFVDEDEERYHSEYF